MITKRYLTWMINALVPVQTAIIFNFDLRAINLDSGVRRNDGTGRGMFRAHSVSKVEYLSVTC